MLDEELTIGSLLPLRFVDLILLLDHFFGYLVGLVGQEVLKANQLGCKLGYPYHLLPPLAILVFV